MLVCSICYASTIESSFKIVIVFTTVNGTGTGEIDVDIDTVDGIPVGMSTLSFFILFWL